MKTPLHDQLGIAPSFDYMLNVSLNSLNGQQFMSPALLQDLQHFQKIIQTLTTKVSALTARVELTDTLFSVLLGDEEDERAFLDYLHLRGLDNLKALAIMNSIHKIRGPHGLQAD